MAMWLYQLTQAEWSVSNYRVDIWEGERWRWDVKKVVGTDKKPVAGDMICFYYAKAECPAPGFYAWAVILQWVEDGDVRRVYFRPVAPSDQLKMRPWWDDEARRIADAIRGPVPRGTLWAVSDDHAATVADGIRRWVYDGSRSGGSSTG